MEVGGYCLQVGDWESKRKKEMIIPHLADDDHTLVLQVLHDAVADSGLPRGSAPRHTDDKRVPVSFGCMRSTPVKER